MVNLKYNLDGFPHFVKTGDENVIIQETRDGNRRIITVTAFQDIVLEDAYMYFRKYYTPEDSIMANGYQSWTATKEFSMGESLKDLDRLPKRLIDKYSFKSYGSQAFWKNEKKVPLGFDFSYIEGESPLFIGSYNYKNAYLLIWFEEENNRIKLQSDVEGKILYAGETYTLFDFVTAENGDEYFNSFVPRTDKKLFGYTSWYNHYQNINEYLILDALEKSDVRFDLFQIDDGFETKIGDWLDIDETKFPNGLGPVIEAIHKKNMMAGIWLAPFVAENESNIFVTHPEWIARDKRKRAISAGCNWSGFSPLDLNNGEVVEYIRKVLRFYKDLGFDFFKLDFLYAVNLCRLEGKTRSETSEFAYSLLREELGDRLILGCGATLSNAFERFDYCRVGPDVSLSFDDALYMRALHAERISTKVTLQNTIFRYCLNGHAFLNDPDVFLLRYQNIKLSFDQRTALTKINALFGSMLMTSDNIAEYDDEKKKVLEDALNIFKNAKLIEYKKKPHTIFAEFELNGRNRVFIYDFNKGVLTEKVRRSIKAGDPEHSKIIFGNKIDERIVSKAEKSKNKYIEKYGDDSDAEYRFGVEDVPALEGIGIKKLVFADEPTELSGNPLVVGNIRMGFGHYRISIAMASCAKALGFTPYWLDLAGFDATGSKMIREQNDMYSLASRISQKSHVFNHFVWEPLNKEGFRQIAYNAKDQKNSELLKPIVSALPKEIPYIATHVWPSQAAIHAGMTHVVNAIPDNWPMALHLSEGAIHTVQTPFAYLGYKMMNGFSKENLKGIPESNLKMVGRYVDHELLVNLEEDNSLRIRRAEENAPMRFLMTVGGAGAGFDQFLSMLKHLIPLVRNGKASVFINFGDHEDVYEKINRMITGVPINRFCNDYEGLKKFIKSLRGKDRNKKAITMICDQDIFKAVYATNLLMPESDVLITKPSELAYYPIPKLFMKHIGGHEAYGAICSQEAGDGTFECDTNEAANNMIDRLITDKELFIHMCQRINDMKKNGDYKGAYECVKLAAGIKE